MCTWQNRMAYSSRVGSLHQKHTNTSCYAWTCQSRTKRRTWGWIGSRFTSIQGELPHSSCNVLTCLLPLAQTGLCYSLQPAEGWQFHRSESPSCPADHTAQIEWWMAVRTPAKQERKRGRKYIKEWRGWRAANWNWDYFEVLTVTNGVVF